MTIRTIGPAAAAALLALALGACANGPRPTTPQPGPSDVQVPIASSATPDPSLQIHQKCNPGGWPKGWRLIYAVDSYGDITAIQAVKDPTCK